MKISIILLFVFSFSNAFTLKDGFKYALENDMDYKVSKNSLKSIGYDQDIANALLHPSIDFSASVEASKLTEDSLKPKSGSHTKSDEYELKITQPIFDGFESKYEKKLQKERFKSAVYFAKESEGTVASEYTQAYINTLKQKDLLSLSKESLEVSQNIFNKVYKKVDAGYGTKLEFEEAKGNFAENKVNLNIQRINLKEAIENLRLYVQTDFDTSELVKPNFYVKMPKKLDEALKIALKTNPSVNVSKANVQVAVFEEKKLNKNAYPDLDLVGSYKLNNAVYAANDEEYNEYSLGFELKYNLYDGGKNRAETKKALQNIRDKQLLIKKSEYQVKNKLRVAWNNYKLYKEKQDSLEQYLIVKKDILGATIKEFDLGMKDLNTLLDTHVEYIDVKKDLIRNTYDLLIAKYNILDSMGTLSDALQDNLPMLEDIDTSDVVKNLQEQTQYAFNNDKDLKNKKLKVIKPKIKKVSKKREFSRDIEIPVKKAAFTEEEIIEKIDSTFKQKFLNAPKNKYTINLALSSSESEAQKFLDKHDLNDNAFYFSYKDVNVLQRIVMGIYDSFVEAKRDLHSLSKELKRNQPIIERISRKQNLYYKYNKNESLQKDIVVRNRKNLVKRVSFSDIKPKVKKVVEKTSSYNSFKDKFLNASKDKYTINIAYSDSKTKAQALLDRYGMSKNAFFFQFRNEKPLQRIVYGVFNSKEEAFKALANLDKRIKKNKPVVERITRKQNTFYKYNKYVSPSALGSI